MFELPTSTIIEDIEYPIRNKGDYRVILDCFQILNDSQLKEKERVILSLIIFYEDALSFDSEGNIVVEKLYELFDSPDKLNQAVDFMNYFFNCGDMRVGAKHNYKLLDWEQDTHLIASAVNNVAHVEIRELEYLHWWTFMGYFISIGESTLSTVVSIRSKIVKGKKLEKHEKEFRVNNPQYFVWNRNTVEQQELEDYVMSLWNGDKQE